MGVGWRARYSVVEQLQSLNELEVTCTDPAGNVGRSRLRVLRRAVHEVAAGEPWPELDQGLAESGTRSTLVRLGPGEHRVECRIRGDVELVGEDRNDQQARRGDGEEQQDESDVAQLRRELRSGLGRAGVRVGRAHDQAERAARRPSGSGSPTAASSTSADSISSTAWSLFSS